MGYRMTYLRINSQGYASSWQSDAAKEAFRAESRRLFQESGWDLTIGKHGARPDRFHDLALRVMEEMICVSP